MTRHQRPIDQRPFQPKAKLEQQQDLEARYGELAIKDVTEALRHIKHDEEERRRSAAA